mmetsp:Transcript_13294/g.33901  ORF Transcript_13294/g.33901 Transcript_13294/m.33901 type:complete len:228 (+) Transcript_13294:367-1050(+)
MQLSCSMRKVCLESCSAALQRTLMCCSTALRRFSTQSACSGLCCWYVPVRKWLRRLSSPPPLTAESTTPLKKSSNDAPSEEEFSQWSMRRRSSAVDVRTAFVELTIGGSVSRLVAVTSDVLQVNGKVSLVVNDTFVVHTSREYVLSFTAMDARGGASFPAASVSVNVFTLLCSWYCRMWAGMRSGCGIFCSSRAITAGSGVGLTGVTLMNLPFFPAHELSFTIFTSW